MLNVMLETEIQEALLPFTVTPVPDDTARQIRAYLDLLLRWNERMNLTAVRDERSILGRHFGESLFAARHLLEPDSELSVIDVGSGAGFPGIPLKLWAPATSITLVEAHGKKATFLREVGRALKLTGFTVENQRAERLAITAQLVTMRAVESFEAVLPSARKLVAVGGRLGLLIGSGQVDRATEILGAGPHAVDHLPGSGQRVLAQWQM